MRFLGAALCGALLSTWLLSGSFSLSWYVRNIEFRLGLGRFYACTYSDYPDLLALIGSSAGGPQWYLKLGFHGELNNGNARAEIPLWFPLLIVALGTAYFWRRDMIAARRARAGMCPKCNYDRTGL